MKVLRTAATVLTVLTTVIAVTSTAHAGGTGNRTFDLPVIKAGDKYEVVVTCKHASQRVVSGGAKVNRPSKATMPIRLTGSYPRDARSWVFEITNVSGRPTGAREVNVTFNVLCKQWQIRHRH